METKSRAIQIVQKTKQDKLCVHEGGIAIYKRSRYPPINSMNGKTALTKG